jgi:AraC-like DNA-binding protein
MIFFVTILGIVLSILIFLNRAERFGSNFYLALFIFCHSFFAITSFAFLSSEFRWLVTRIYPFTVLMNMSAGPLLYLYFASVFQPNFKFRKKYLFHFLPSVLFFINASPYLYMGDAEKNAFVNAFLNDHSIGFNVPTLLVPYYFHVVFRMTQSFLYLLLSFQMFFNSFRSNHFRIRNAQGYHYGYYCMCFLFGFGFYGMFIYVGININPSNRSYFGSVGAMNTLIASPRFLNAMFILTALFHPKLVFEKYFIEKSKPEFRSLRKKNPTLDPKAAKYDLVEIDRLFTEYIETKPYLSAGFSLNMISDGTKLPVHQISYYIKHQYDLTFNEWKNEQRIKHAVELINAGHADQLTLESISLQCGYLSRANFVEAFKKVMGLTPSEFLANHNKK